MGKLVLYLEDGRAKAIPLDKERLVIGRRADNDVCLPFPAVSGEHAAVVTLATDSFLEDLGSTNGTLVNGKPITKHFLRDHDEIDVGRQRLTYLADENAPIDTRSVFATRSQARTFGEQVERIEPSLRERRAPGAGKAPESGERRGSLEAGKARAAEVAKARANGVAKVATAAAAPAAAAAGNRASATPAPAAPRTEAKAPATTLRAAPVAASVPSVASTATGAKASPTPRPRPGAPLLERAVTRVARPAPESAAGMPLERPTEPSGSVGVPASGGEIDTFVHEFVATGSTATRAEPREPEGRINVLSGPSAGRSIAVGRAAVTVGRVGDGVAVIRPNDAGYLLMPARGETPPKLAGAEVPADGVPLQGGETFEVAGVRLEFVAPVRAAAVATDGRSASRGE